MALSSSMVIKSMRQRALVYQALSEGDQRSEI
jgi:hypothetical protein